MAFTLDKYGEEFEKLQDGYTIKEIEPKDGIRYFTVVKVEIPEEWLLQNKIAELKDYLNSTDYVVIKIAEGESTPEEYADTLQKRRDARAQLNELMKGE